MVTPQGHPDPDGRDLAVRAALVGRHPDPAAALDGSRGQAQVGADGAQHALHPPDVRDHVDRVGQ